MARLQTFPDDVVVTGSLAEAQRQLGNAVPSLLGEVLAREIANQLLRCCDKGPASLAIAQAPENAPRSPGPAPVPKNYVKLSRGTTRRIRARDRVRGPWLASSSPPNKRCRVTHCFRGSVDRIGLQPAPIQQS